MDSQPNDYEIWLAEMTQQHPDWELEFASQATLRQAVEIALRTGDIGRIRTFLRNRVGTDLFVCARAQRMVDLEAQSRKAFGSEGELA